MVCARSCCPENLASCHSLIVEAHGVSAALYQSATLVAKKLILRPWALAETSNPVNELPT